MAARWLKVDVKPVRGPAVPGLGSWGADAVRRLRHERNGPGGGLLDRARSALDRHRPSGVWRAGPVIAVVGPDGAGKGTLVAGLRRVVPVTVTPIYLGHGSSAESEYAGGAVGSSGAGAAVRRLALRAARSLVGLLPAGARELQHAARRSLGECRSVARAHAYAWRGDIVICDRHPLELLLVGEPRPGAAGLLERAVRERLLPHPDALVLLDAPAGLMYDRKGEHSVQLLERQRTRYRDALVPRGATVVSTGG